LESAALGQDLAQGARYLDELIAADVLVIGAPMYNHGVPSQLKAWIDRVVVAGKTFRYTERGPEGLLAASKKVFIAASSGGLYSGDSPARAFEHSVSYLTGVLAHMGLKDVTVIRAEGVAMGPEARQNAFERARRAIGESQTRLAAWASRRGGMFCSCPQTESDSHFLGQQNPPITRTGSQKVHH
jgi:FMN-dependent NADH-azoreductase